MLPRDMTGIIEKYNEDGAFMDDGDNIFWFNGKRFEFWCQRPPKSDMLYIGNDIYAYGHCQVYKYHKMQFKVWDHNINKILQTFFHTVMCDFAYFQDGSIVTRENGYLVLFDFKLYKIINFHVKFVAFGKFLFIFDKLIKKIDIQSKQLFDIGVCDITSGLNIVQCNGMLYFFDGMKCKKTFNLLKEEWQLSFDFH